MRVNLLFIVLLIAGCATSKSGRDFTVNHSRSKENSPRKHVAYKTSSTDTPARGIVTTAEQLIGAKYRYGGNAPQKGFDCSGFTSYVLGQHGRRLPRTSGQQAQCGRRKRVADAVPGDLIFFGTGTRVTHVAIVSKHSRSKLEIIHSTSSGGVCRDEVYSSKYWNTRLLWAVDTREL